MLRLTEPRSGAGLETGALMAEAGLAGLVAVKLVVGQFARVRATPGLGGETAQHARATPRSVAWKPSGMQAGVAIGNRTPRANEGGFRKSFERISERDTKMPLIRRSKLV